MFSFSHMLRDSTYIYVVYIKASGVKPPLQIHGSLNSHAGLPPQNESPSLSKLCGTSFLSTDALPRERRPLFTHPEVVQPLISLLGETAQAHFFDVYAYWFMPDHCHAILCGRARFATSHGWYAPPKDAQQSRSESVAFRTFGRAAITAMSSVTTTIFALQPVMSWKTPSAQVS